MFCRSLDSAKTSQSVVALSRSVILWQRLWLSWGYEGISKAACPLAHRITSNQTFRIIAASRSQNELHPSANCSSKVLSDSVHLGCAHADTFLGQEDFKRLFCNWVAVVDSHTDRVYPIASNSGWWWLVEAFLKNSDSLLLTVTGNGLHPRGVGIWKQR